MLPHPLLYYITDRTQFGDDEDLRRRRLLETVGEAARCGVDFIQLREKDLSTRELEQLAAEAAGTVARSSPQQAGSRTKLLINSRTDIAIAVGADGVHLRSEDVSPSDVRAVVRRNNFIIAVSCHTPAEVARAAAEGADFAVLAPVFEKKDAPATPSAGLDSLRQACHHNIPVLALGGITIENARLCVEAGAAGVAGIRLFQENRIAEVVRALRS